MRHNPTVSQWALLTQTVEAFREVQNLCHREHIPLLPVKGLVIAQMLYAPHEWRRFSDLDVRILLEDLPRFLHAVHREKWPVLCICSSYRSLVFQIGGLMVDVETSIGPPGLCGLTVESMLQRSTEQEAPFGCLHRQPELHDHALLLCINAFKDKWLYASTTSLHDLERIFDHPAFCLSTFLARAAASEAMTIVWITAYWSARHRKHLGWQALVTHLGPPRRKLYTQTLCFLLERTCPLPLALCFLARIGSDRRAARIVALRHLVQYGLEIGAQGVRHRMFHQNAT